MDKQDSDYHISYEKHNLGEIITFKGGSPRGYIYCSGQDIFDLIEVYPDLVNWLILVGRTHNYDQFCARRLLQERVDLRNMIAEKRLDSIKCQPGKLYPPGEPLALEDITYIGKGMNLNPGYYSCFTIEPIDYIVKNKLSFCQGNVVKYVTRYNKKHPSKAGRIEDLEKAISNLQKLIKEVEEQDGE